MASYGGGPMRQGSGFINFDQYLAANRGSAQSLADRLSGEVRKQGQKAQGVIEPAMDEFNSRLNAGGPSEYLPGSVADISGFQQGQEEADKAAQASRRLADIYGRMGSLGEMYGATPGYNYGMRGLDSALAGAVGQGQFEGMRKEYGDLSKQYGDALDASEKRAGEVRDYRSRQQQPVQQQAPIVAASAATSAEAPRSSPWARSADEIANDNKKKAKYGFRG